MCFVPDVYVGLTVGIHFLFPTRLAANLISIFKFRIANSAVFLIRVDYFCLIADVIRITDISTKNSRRSVACNST